ncbi:hypothetical protein C3K47_05385 [Solitalea longa]|uniref:Potassium channel domain-containing protein n=1 Tax=Solitalea longa TaxID=2079460 RepID=A0A2S5A6N8_9SPHI|nr:potassium channel family protein [Solitalea longa]POY37957.1 hypothetical protein C3K47_05385 [Solitalea longa]
MRKFFFRMVDFWSHDRSFSVVLVLLCIVIFLLSPLKSIGVPYADTLLELFLTVLLISGVFAVSERRAVRYPAVIIGVFSFVIKWLNTLNYDQDLTRLDLLLSMVYFTGLLIVILKRVLGEGKISVNRIEGAISAYLIIAILFSFSFRIVYSYIPNAFLLHFSTEHLWVEDIAGHFTYFSFVTLTTTGYGDITPLHPFARSLAMLEGLIGQLYPAVLIARLVSMEIEARKGK